MRRSMRLIATQQAYNTCMKKDGRGTSMGEPLSWHGGRRTAAAAAAIQTHSVGVHTRWMCVFKIGNSPLVAGLAP